MQDSLRGMVEGKMGIRNPGEVKPAERLKHLRDLDMLPAPELQELQWNAGRKFPELMAKGAKIIKAQKRKDVWVKYLAAENEIFEKYLYPALAAAGYKNVDKVGSHSTGFDYLYVHAPPLCCPFCKKVLKGFKKEI